MGSGVKLFGVRTSSGRSTAPLSWGAVPVGDELVGAIVWRNLGS